MDSPFRPFSFDSIGWNRLPCIILLSLFVVAVAGAALPGFGAPAAGPKLAPAPPMGWNDWAHYQCNHAAQTIFTNARALVKTGELVQ